MSNCENCEHKKVNEGATVPAAFHKATIDGKNTIIKLLAAIIIIQFIGFLIFIGYKEYLASKYDTCSEDIDVITDGGGDANYADDGSDIRYYYGKDQD